MLEPFLVGVQSLAEVRLGREAEVRVCLLRVEAR